MNDGEAGFIYARDAHPNAKLLGELLADAEGAEWGVITGSGMAAISAIVLATVEQGQRILASNRLYGRTVQLFTQELARFGVAAELRRLQRSQCGRVGFAKKAAASLCRNDVEPAGAARRYRRPCGAGP